MLRTNVQTLRSAFARVIPVIERRNTIPILSMARLTAEAGVVTIAGSDLDMQLDVDAFVEVTREGQAAVHARQILGVLRHLSKLDPVELTVDGPAAFLTWPGGKARIAALSAMDFPEFTFTGDAVSARLDEDDFAAIARVAPFISTEETRYYLNGIGLDTITGGTGVVVATDGHRLATMPISASFAAIPAAISKPIIPRRAVEILLGLRIGEADVTFHRVNKSAAKAQVVADGVRLSTKLIDGAYPDWKRVIPTDVGQQLELSRLDLMRACILAEQMTGHHHESALVVEGGRAQLQSAIDDRGLAVDLGVAPAKASWVMPINAHFLRSAIAAVRGPTATLSRLDDTSPVSIVGTELRHGEHVVVMPLRYATRRLDFSAPVKEAA